MNAPLEPWRLKRDPLDDFTAEDLTFGAERRQVFVSGKGPAVIVIAEIPGITPEVARFARWVRDAGFTVFMPVLFGDPGRPASLAYGVSVVTRACVSRQFRALTSNVTAPVTVWLRALAASAHVRCGGKGVGAVGMCFTGNFALSMMLEPAMLAPVLCQPSLPIGRKGGVHTDPDELAAIRSRMERENLLALAYRFEGDALCPGQRFKDYDRLLGDRIQLKSLPASSANPAAPIKAPHSVVTQHLIDREGEPTRAAVDEILAFFRERLIEA
ncbi:MAG: dienelactone hydrolase family protein [Archangium sp.]|nr:dienelactone hydrolase family protein [Archangium sp.]